MAVQKGFCRHSSIHEVSAIGGLITLNFQFSFFLLLISNSSAGSEGSIYTRLISSRFVDKHRPLWNF